MVVVDASDSEVSLQTSTSPDESSLSARATRRHPRHHRLARSSIDHTLLISILWASSFGRLKHLGSTLSRQINFGTAPGFSARKSISGRGCGICIDSTAVKINPYGSGRRPWRYPSWCLNNRCAIELYIAYVLEMFTQGGHLASGHSRIKLGVSSGTLALTLQGIISQIRA